MKISAVVAASDNNAIGLKGSLLWHLPKDLKFFRDTTYGHHVIMGRKSYESIPHKYRPLDGRVNIIVTRQKNYHAPGCKVVSTAEEGIEFARDAGETELMILGGGEIYRHMLPHTDRIYLTRVRHNFYEADTYFPDVWSGDWKVASTQKHSADAQHSYDFEFIVLERIR